MSRKFHACASVIYCCLPTTSETLWLKPPPYMIPPDFTGDSLGAQDASLMGGNEYERGLCMKGRVFGDQRAR